MIQPVPGWYGEAWVPMMPCEANAPRTSSDSKNSETHAAALPATASRHASDRPWRPSSASTSWGRGGSGVSTRGRSSATTSSQKASHRG